MTTVRFKIDLAKPKMEPRVRPPPVVHGREASRGARRLALAYWIDRKIEAGELKDYAAAARWLGVTRARVTQVANLRLLPVEQQDEMLLQ